MKKTGVGERVHCFLVGISMCHLLHEGDIEIITVLINT